MALNVQKALRKAQGLARKGDSAGAAALFREVLEQYPGNRQAAQGLSQLQQVPSRAAGESHQFQLALQDVVRLFNAGHSQRALQQAEVLVRQHPREPVLYNLIGAALTDLQQYDRAIAAYRAAIEIHPRYAEAYSNLGAACNELGHHSAAITAYTRAIELQPDMPEAHNNLGNAYRESGLPEQAIACYRHAISLKPDFAATHNNLGCAMSDLGRYAEGAASSARALELRPTFAKARGMVLHQLAHMCDWDAMEPLRAGIPALGVEGEPVIPFELLHLEDEPARHRQRSEAFARKAFPRIETPAVEPPGKRPEKLRVGYFSADFADHATLYLMIRFFELHDRSRFEVHAFCNTPGDGGAMRERLRKVVDGYHQIADKSDTEVAALARQLPLDIAVDLKGYTQRARLGVFAYRPAPISVTWIGYPGTTGAPFMDYLIGDATVTPATHEHHYSESIIRLPVSYQVNDNTRAIATHAPGRQESGLPEQGFVFCCFNNNNKISPDEFDVWMRLLDHVPGSVLWLFKSNEWARDNLRAQAERRGIAPERLVFAEKLPLAEHLARVTLADLFLDTFNYNAHTTASDALWAGVPVVTKLGEGFAARVAASLLRAVGLDELVTTSVTEYEQLALALAGDPTRLGTLKQTIMEARSTAPLFDSERTTRDVETAYDAIYQRWLDGEVPTALDV